MKGISRNALKWIAMITMVSDHMACVFLSPDSLPVPYYLLRGIGRISFPLFCFLLAQGMQYTHSRGRYLFRLFLFAVISEIPFDLAISGKWVDMSIQNVFFTLLLGAAAVWGLQVLQSCTGSFCRLALYCLTVSAGMAMAVLLRTDYSLWGVLMILFFYDMGECSYSSGMSTALFLGMFFLCLAQGVFELPALAAFPLIYWYSPHKAGGETTLPRGFYYGFYPAHLFLFWCMKEICNGFW